MLKLKSVHPVYEELNKGGVYISVMLNQKFKLYIYDSYATV